ncbi:class A sortase SrtA, partial [Staphylococcus epidermidis]
MKKWTSRLTTFIGVLLILLAIYLFAKPHID